MHGWTSTVLMVNEQEVQATVLFEETSEIESVNAVRIQVTVVCRGSCLSKTYSTSNYFFGVMLLVDS
jgi:hypothetical protein